MEPLLTSSDYEMLVVRVRERTRCQLHEACSAMPRLTRLSLMCERELPCVVFFLPALRGRHKVCVCVFVYSKKDYCREESTLTFSPTARNTCSTLLPQGQVLSPGLK